MLIEKFKNSTLADWLAVITGGLFITGMCFNYGYYGPLGLSNSWIINLLNAKEILTVNIILLVTYLMAIMYLELYFAKEKVNFSRLVITSNIVLILLAIVFGIQNTWVETFFYIIVIIALNSMFWIINIRSTKRYFGFIILLLVVPYLNGVYSFHKDTSENRLSLAFLDNDLNSRWYILNTYADKAILIDRKNSHKRKIKIVETKDIKIIRKES